MRKLEPMIQRVLKQKRCKVCKRKFTPHSGLQVVDTPQCAILYARIKSEGVQRKKDKRRLNELKTKSQWLKEAQREFNSFIRLRDYKLPCISCGRNNKCKFDAGHYLSVGARPDLRFTEDNVHKQCSQCNTHKSGNQVEYRRRLVERISEAGVEKLEFHGPALRLIVPDIQAIKDKYRKKANELRKLMDSGQC